MAQAFSTVIGSDGERTYVSQVESAECEILIRAIDELITVLAGDPPDEAVGSAPNQEPRSSDPLFDELGLGDLFDTAGSADFAEPSEPVSARLFPPGYIGDQSAARDFRRFTEPELRQEKIANARLVQGTLVAALAASPSQVELGSTEAASWLRGINDLRLTLAVQVGVGQPNELELGAEPENQPARGIYEFLTWWQDSLLESLM